MLKERDKCRRLRSRFKVTVLDTSDSQNLGLFGDCKLCITDQNLQIITTTTFLENNYFCWPLTQIYGFEFIGPESAFAIHVRCKSNEENETEEVYKFYCRKATKLFRSVKNLVLDMKRKRDIGVEDAKEDEQENIHQDRDVLIQNEMKKNRISYSWKKNRRKKLTFHNCSVM